MTDEEWKELRSEIAEEISAVVAGPDSAKFKKVSNDVSALLQKARGLSKAEFQKQQSELQKAASKIIGDVRPTWRTSCPTRACRRLCRLA
jgi:hypothetical protein